MNNVSATPVLFFTIALFLAGCQSAPSGTDAAQPAKPAEAKQEANPVLVAPTPHEATSASKPAEAMPAAPEAKTETMTVAEMQKRLTELGYKPGPIDGAAGKRTMDALKQFQHANHLPATGTLDPETIRKLQSAKR